MCVCFRGLCFERPALMLMLADYFVALHKKQCALRTRNLCMGPAVRAPRWSPDSRACHARPLPHAGLDVGDCWRGRTRRAIDASNRAVSGQACHHYPPPHKGDRQYLKPATSEPVIPPAIAVYGTLGIAFSAYATFCADVISDFTEYLGIACFTVRKRDKNGEWVDASKLKKQ